MGRGGYVEKQDCWGIYIEQKDYGEIMLKNKVMGGWGGWNYVKKKQDCGGNYVEKQDYGGN